MKITRYMLLIETHPFPVMI